MMDFQEVPKGYIMYKYLHIIIIFNLPKWTPPEIKNKQPMIRPKNK